MDIQSNRLNLEKRYKMSIPKSTLRWLDEYSQLIVVKKCFQLNQNEGLKKWKKARGNLTLQEMVLVQI